MSIAMDMGLGLGGSGQTGLGRNSRRLRSPAAIAQTSTVQPLAPARARSPAAPSPCNMATPALNRCCRPSTLAGLANLELVARTAVEGFLTGLHRSPQYGFSQEFKEYRAYVEGDDPRFVDWNVYARTERTYIRRYEGDTNTRLMILLDASASMGYGSQSLSKLQYGKFLAAALAYLAARQHDPVGLIVFDERLRNYRPATSRAGSLVGMIHAIDAVAPGRRHRSHGLLSQPW